MKKLLKLLMSRFVIVALLILFQLILIAFSIILFSGYQALFYVISMVIGVIVVCRIVNKKDNPSYKIAWIILLLVVPPFGVMIYFIFKGNKLSERTKRKMAGIALAMSEASLENLGDKICLPETESARRQSDYITHTALCPPYSGTKAIYFPSGEDMFADMLEKLKRAEKYIFLEYFIIDRGIMWEGIHNILLDKVSEGVDVRIIYDDMGCITHLDTGFNQVLEREGIKCRVFNRFIPVLSARLNNRNHRKICVIDGTVAYTGGVNIADEYINETHPYGYWKDNAVLLEGRGAWSFTVMFLSMWDYLDGPVDSIKNRYLDYLPECFPEHGEGIVQPYTDNPLDDAPVGETIYLNMMYSAKRYIWITTPYLIIDYNMEQALCNAAASGIDVRIITPGIADKFFVNEATKGHYKKLITSGVRLFEYTPGFIHAKTFICDDIYATVGTVNLDFRSLYLHFECGVWFYRSPVIGDIKADYENTLEQCCEVTEDNCKVGIFRRGMRSVIELMAPLI